MAWFRWYEEATSDPKFMVVARRSGQPVAFVVAVWAMLLERANAASPRGYVTGFDCESADVMLGMPDGAAEAILVALRGKGLLDGEDGDHVARWEERQPKREDGSAERAKEWRERKKTETNAQDVPVNTGERTRTQPNARREEIRKEKEERENTASAPPLASPAAERTLVVLPVGGEAAIPATTASPAQSPEQALPEQALPEPEATPAATPAALDVPPSRPRGKKQHHAPPEGEPHYRAKSGRYLTGKRLASFERFWAAFDLRMGKTDAADAWLDIPQLTDALVDEICRAAELEAQQRVVDTARGKSPKWPQGWLNSRRWEDYEPLKSSAKPTAQTVPLTALHEPTPEELEANRQRALRHMQQWRGERSSGPVRANFAVAVAGTVARAAQ